MLLSHGQNILPAIGQWREHLPYNTVIDVSAGNNKIYAATPYSLFLVDITQNSIERFSKISGLSETGVSVIKYDEANNKLVIAYSNSNLDIITGNAIINIPDLKRQNISGDKSVYNIYPHNKNYFLSTGIGIIVIDGEKNEVKDSWRIGNAGNAVRVNGFTSDATNYYAATEEGLKKVAINTPDPANFQRWELMSGFNGLAAGEVRSVVALQNKIVVLKNDSLFAFTNGNWHLFYADGWPLVNVNISGDQLQLSQRKPDGNSKVTILNTDGTVAFTFQQPGVISFPRNAVFYNNEYWIADQYGGLSRFESPAFFERYQLPSPLERASGQMVIHNGILYATAGEVNGAWNYQYNRNGIYKFANADWTNYNRNSFPLLDSVMDFISIAIDPVDESVWAGSFGGGLLHIKDDQSLEIFKQNSALTAAIGDPGSYRVSGLAFDEEHNLWISNFGSAQPLVVKKNDGAWKSFTLPFNVNGNALSSIVIDDDNQKWIASPASNGLIVYDHGDDINNTGDDQWKLYRAGTGSGNLPSNDVLSIAKDKNGFIWVGTADGIGVIQCPSQALTPQGCEAILPVAQQGNFNGYLFKGEEVRSIAVDGADRKWVATKNGVWLISATGEEVIYQFTENNSPLLSNDVRQVAIDGKSGEVYFATLNGICSFRSSATDGREQNENVIVFPNPVPPGFEGTIAIRGLVENAIVKITELNGRLVYQTRALGGQAIWNGRNYNGQKIASGAYLVLVSDDGRQEKTVTKIFFISK
jgi:hypothetical protein